MRKARIAAIVAIVAAAAVAATLVIWGTGREAARLAREGGVIQLRDPLRPIRGTTRLLVVALDGVGDRDLRTAIRAGHLRSVASLVGRELEEDIYERAYAVPDAVSVLPASTMGAWASVFTGEPPGRTGVPGNEWFVREERRFYAPGPVSVQDHQDVIRMFTEDLLGQNLGVPTLFDRLNLRSHLGLMPIFGGADLVTVPSLRDVGALFGRLAGGLGDDEPVSRQPYAALDEGAVERLLEQVETHGLPDVQVVYLSGVDLYTHTAEPPLPELQRYLHDILDPAIGRILDVYAQLGALDDTFIVLVSDHGHTPVLKDDRHALATDDETDPPALVERAGYRLRPFVLEPAAHEQDYQVVLAYEGAFARVYVADRSTCPSAGDRCDWTSPPRLVEDVLPLVTAFDRAGRYGELVPELRDTLDLILVREPRPLDQAPLPFDIWDGSRAVPIGEYLRRNPRPDLIRLEERLDGLATGSFGHRAGDVLLLARSGMHRPIEERFYFSSVNHSWHGSPEAQDSRIPILVAHPRRSGHELKRQVGETIGATPSQLDIVPLLESLLQEQGNGDAR